MEPAPHSARRRGATAIDAAVGLMAVLLIVQMWLLMASLNTVLAGEWSAALPAALVSLALFLACLALYILVERVDAAARADARHVAEPPAGGRPARR
ncbi:MAG: DUF6755 family protein [Candidatus Methylomirabilales bacterium]